MTVSSSYGQTTSRLLLRSVRYKSKMKLKRSWSWRRLFGLKGGVWYYEPIVQKKSATKSRSYLPVTALLQRFRAKNANASPTASNESEDGSGTADVPINSMMTLPLAGK